MLEEHIVISNLLFMPWSCRNCSRVFLKTNQKHYCSDKNVSDFLTGKSEIALNLFDSLMAAFAQIGAVKLETTKSMIVIVAETRFAYIITIGKTFIDVVLPFPEAYEDNYCFRKIGLVPGGKHFNHHLRLLYEEDINEEVKGYLEKAYQYGKAI